MQKSCIIYNTIGDCYAFNAKTYCIETTSCFIAKTKINVSPDVKFERFKLSTKPCFQEVAKPFFGKSQ